MKGTPAGEATTTASREATTSDVRRVTTMCPMNCDPTLCGMTVEVQDDRVVSVRGDPQNPDSRGFLCIRGRAAGEIVDNPERVLRPRVRDARTPGAWRDATWEAALDTVATAIRRAGPEAVAVWVGHGILVNRIGFRLAERFAMLGGFQWWEPAIVCWGLGGFGVSLTGPVQVSTKEDMAAHSDLILVWGANIASQPTTGPHLVAARRRGARIVAIDVRQTEVFEQADEAYLIRPGTDAALALALIHVIVGEALHDRDFVARHTTGFPELATHVTACTPEWGEAVTGIPAASIRLLARRYAGTKRSMILLGGSSMHKSGNGWQAGRAISCLPALTGALGRPGGGFGPRHAARSHGMGMSNISASDRRPPTPSGRPYVISEMSRILDALETGHVRVLLLFGTNMVSSFADAGRLARALDRLDLVVTHDLFMHDTARRHADVLLPGTSWLEETGFKVTNTHLYLMDQAISARGQARSVVWVTQALARILDIDGFFPWPDTDALLEAQFDHPATRHVTPAQLRTQGGRQELAISHVAHPDLRFPTPSGRVEFFSEKARALGLSPLPVYEPMLEDASRQPERARRYPLVFRQGRSLTHFHSFYDHGRALPTLAKADAEPRLWISLTDAVARRLADGDAIRIFNDRGAMQARAKITDRVPPGVVWMRDGWAGINDLTSSARSIPDAAARSFPGGQASYEARVEVESTGAR